MTQQQDSAIYSAYLGIKVLRMMCSSAGLKLGASRAKQITEELEVAFPSLITKQARPAETR
jgi:hypothetical protein